MTLTKFQRDAAERVAWTFAQAAVGVLAVEAAGWDPLWAVPAAAILASVKTLIARRIGDRDSAATLPAYIDAAARDLGIKVAKATLKKAADKK